MKKTTLLCPHKLTMMCAAVITVFVLSGCGKIGPLELPENTQPSSEKTSEEVDEDSFILDKLL